MLCDTNGASLPFEVERVVGTVRDRIDVTLGCHLHNDSGCAVANSLVAVRHGVTQVQGCINGYGERTGNANLTSVIPNLTLKMGIETIPRERLERLTPVAHHVAELVNISPDPQQPFVGHSAFAHKAGLHTSAIARQRTAYEHVEPGSVGNGTRFVVCEMAGRATLALKAEELGLDLDGDASPRWSSSSRGSSTRATTSRSPTARSSCSCGAATGWEQDWFRVESHRVINEQREDGTFVTEATIKVHVGDERVIATAEGNGPVNALDAALRKAIGLRYPELIGVHLTDYKVRVLDTRQGPRP